MYFILLLICRTSRFPRFILKQFHRKQIINAVSKSSKFLIECNYLSSINVWFTRNTSETRKLFHLPFNVISKLNFLLQTNRLTDMCICLTIHAPLNFIKNIEKFSKWGVCDLSFRPLNRQCRHISTILLSFDLVNWTSSFFEEGM